MSGDRRVPPGGGCVVALILEAIFILVIGAFAIGLGLKIGNHAPSGTVSQERQER